MVRGKGCCFVCDELAKLKPITTKGSATKWCDICDCEIDEDTNECEYCGGDDI
jgi:hypothetical protein